MKKKRENRELFAKRYLLGITENLKILPEEAEELDVRLRELDEKLLHDEDYIEKKGR